MKKTSGNKGYLRRYDYDRLDDNDCVSNRKNT